MFIMDFVVAVLRELEIGMPHIQQDLSGEHKCSEYCPQEDKLIYVKPNNSPDAYFEIAHELRHKWQWIKHYEEYFIGYKELDKVDLKKYGKQIAEVDANAFAVIMGAKYLDAWPQFLGRSKKEKKKIYDRAKVLSKEYEQNINASDWKEIYQVLEIN